MVDWEACFRAVEACCDRLGIEIRRERLGGAGGGLCAMRGRRMMFVDLDADLATRTERCLAELAGLPELDGVYVPPVLREALDRHRNTVK